MNERTRRTLSHAAIAGDVLFILWMTFNGIDEGFSGTPMQAASYVGLTAVLLLNIALLWR